MGVTKALMQSPGPRPSGPGMPGYSAAHKQHGYSYMLFYCAGKTGQTTPSHTLSWTIEAPVGDASQRKWWSCKVVAWRTISMSLGPKAASWEARRRAANASD
jgi:hypothetical protein